MFITTALAICLSFTSGEVNKIAKPMIGHMVMLHTVP
jgi:hypothetical protein